MNWHKDKFLVVALFTGLIALGLYYLDNLLSIQKTLVVISFITSLTSVFTKLVWYKNDKKWESNNWVSIIIFLGINLAIVLTYGFRLTFILFGFVALIGILLMVSFNLKKLIDRFMNKFGKNGEIVLILCSVIGLGYTLNKVDDIIGIYSESLRIDSINSDSMSSRPATIYKIRKIKMIKLPFFPTKYQEVYFYFYYNNVRYDGLDTAGKERKIAVNDEYYCEFPKFNPNHSQLNYNRPFDILSILKSVDTSSVEKDSISP